MSKRDRVTATSLVRLLDPLTEYGRRHSSPPSPDYLELLQYSATAKQARKLVDALLAADSDSATTTAAANRDLLYQIDSRLSTAEQQLARLAPTQSSSLLSPPPEVVHEYEQTDRLLSSDLANLDYLTVPSPVTPTFDFADQVARELDLPQAGPESSGGPAIIDGDDTESPLENAMPKPSDLRSSSLRSNGGASSRRSPPSLVTEDAPVQRPIGPGTSSSLDPTLTTSTARQRRGRPQTLVPEAAAGRGEEKPIPAYLVAKRARAAAEKKRLAELERGSDDEKQDSDDDDDGSAIPTRDKVAKKLDDLIPADAVPVGGSGGGGGSDLLGQHHALQTSLLSSLTSLSGALKQSTLSFSDNLAKDKEVMTRAQEQLETSEAGMKSQQARLKEVRGKSRGTTCWTLGLLALVFVLWLLTFLLIKVT